MDETGLEPVRAVLQTAALPIGAIHPDGDLGRFLRLGRLEKNIDNPHNLFNPPNHGLEIMRIKKDSNFQPKP